MLKRKRLYITLSTMLFAGLAIISSVFLLSTRRIPVNAKIKAILDSYHRGHVPGDSQSGNSSNYQYPSVVAGNYRMANYSWIMNLVSASSTTELFGSYRVKGILQDSSAPLLGRAIIEDLSTGISRNYTIGEMLPDNSQLAGMQRDCITLQKNGVRKKIYVFSQCCSEDVRHNTFIEAAFLEHKKIGDNEFMLKPYQAFSGDANRILDFSIKASIINGRMEGIRITDINDNALVRDLGLREDDVLLEANNESINSLYKCFKASINANNSDELQLKIRRGDQCISLTYHLYWEGRGMWTPKDLLNSKAVSSFLDFDFASHLF
jgi:type II secretory pathway component PulC